MLQNVVKMHDLDDDWYKCSPRTGRWLPTDISVHTCLLWVSRAPFPKPQASRSMKTGQSVLHPERVALKGRQSSPHVLPVTPFPQTQLLVGGHAPVTVIHTTHTASSLMWHSRLRATLTQSTTVTQQRRHFPIRSEVVLSSIHSNS